MRESDDGNTLYFTPEERVGLLVGSIGCGVLAYGLAPWLEHGDAPTVVRGTVTLLIGLPLSVGSFIGFFAALFGSLDRSGDP